MISKAVILALLAGLFCQSVLTQTAPKPPRVSATPSSFASVEVHISARRGRSAPAEWWPSEASLAGPSRIAISYGQPHARGRAVERGLIPYDTVWRFGANEATILHTDVDIMVGDLRIPHGDYSLFILNSARGWELIVNRETAQWGLDYDSTRDLGRVQLSAHRLGETQDALSVFLVADAGAPQTERADLGGSLRICWGTVELTARWKVAEG